LGTESDDAEAVSAALLDLYELANDAERKAALPDIAASVPDGIIGKAFPQIKQAIRTWLSQLDTQWNPNLAINIDFTSLELCSVVLSNRFAEKALSDKEKVTILEGIDDLLRLVADSSLPQELKFSLVDGLQELRRVMLMYPTMGVQPIRRAGATIAGDIVINYNQIDRDHQHNNFWDAAVSFIDLVNNATTVAGKVLPVASIFLLGHGHGTGS
jgi:hypothetical protein